jgi:hypothetical protein
MKADQIVSSDFLERRGSVDWNWKLIVCLTG